MADIEPIAQQAIYEVNRERNVAAVEVNRAFDLRAPQPHAAAGNEFDGSRICAQPADPVGFQYGTLGPRPHLFRVVSGLWSRLQIGTFVVRHGGEEPGI